MPASATAWRSKRTATLNREDRLATGKLFPWTEIAGGVAVCPTWPGRVGALSGHVSASSVGRLRAHISLWFEPPEVDRRALVHEHLAPCRAAQPSMGFIIC